MQSSMPSQSAQDAATRLLTMMQDLVLRAPSDPQAKAKIQSMLEDLFKEAFPDGHNTSTSLLRQCRQAVAASTHEADEDGIMDTPESVLPLIRSAMAALDQARRDKDLLQRNATAALLKTKGLLKALDPSADVLAAQHFIDHQVTTINTPLTTQPNRDRTNSEQTINMLDRLHAPFPAIVHGQFTSHANVHCALIDGSPCMVIKTKDGSINISLEQACAFFGLKPDSAPHVFDANVVYMTWHPLDGWEAVPPSMASEAGVVPFGPYPQIMNPTALQADGHRFAWWFNASPQQRQQALNAAFPDESETSGGSQLERWRQAIDLISQDASHTAPSPAPQDFARLFKTQQLGQILLMLDSSSDGATPLLRVCANPTNEELCAREMPFPGAGGMDAARASLNAITLEQAQRIAQRLFDQS